MTNQQTTPESNSKNVHVLLIDDMPELIKFLYVYLSQHFTVHIADSGMAALDIVQKRHIDLILLDVLMPEMDGFETCHRLKSDPDSRDIPVIFMTSTGDIQQKLKAFHIGGVDYLLKPIQPEEVLARITLHLRLRNLQRQLTDKNRQLNTGNRQLQQTIQQQSILFDNSLVGIMFVDAQRKIVQLNDECAQMFGYPKDSLQGESTFVLYANEDDFHQAGSQAYPQLSAGGSYCAEYRMRRRDGSHFWCFLRGKAILPEDMSAGSVWNLEDIDQRKVAEDDLRLASTVFDNVGEALLVCDPATRIIRVNQAFCSLTGYDAEDVIGKNPNVLSSGLHNRRFFQDLWEELLATSEWRGEIWNRHKDGAVFPVQTHITIVRRPDSGISHYVSVMTDISARKRTEEQLTYQAHYDKLTGLPNRSLLHDRLHNALARAKRHHKQVALLYIDLDGFKQVNDTLNHAAGDQVLVQVAKQLEETLREEDTAARLGGDEFVVLLADLEHSEQADVVAKRLIDRLTLKIEEENQCLMVSASIGIAIYPDDTQNEDQLLRYADKAMYRAKQLGRNTYCRARQTTLNKPLPIEAFEKHKKLSIYNPPENTQRLLYIEDNPVDALIIEAILSREGYRVDNITQGHEAMQRLHDGRYVLVLIDYQLPDMTGIELLEYIYQEKLPIPAIIVTAQEDVGVAVEAMKYGAIDYVRKDADLDGLLPAVVARSLSSNRMQQLQAEARQAQEEKAFYQSIFDSAFLALIIMDIDGRIVEANQIACQLFAYSHDEFLRLHGQALFHGQNMALFKQLIDEDSDFPLSEISPLRRDGSILHIEIQRNQINYHGESHWLVLIRDISERKLTESRLRHASIVFDHATEGIMITDKDKFIIAVNQAFTKITQYHETEVLGKQPNILHSGKQEPEFYQNLWNTIDHAGFWQGEIWNRRKNGELFATWQGISRICNEQQESIGYLSIFSDITEQKQFDRKIEYLLHYDALTDLPNRMLLRERLAYAMLQAKHREQPLVVLYLGLDRFKSINESLGPAVGDQVLQKAAERLEIELPEQVYSGRITSDEFACFMELEPTASTQQATALAMQVLSIFARPFTIQEHLLHLSVTLGISLYPRDGDEAPMLLKHACTAMSRAKGQGGNHYQFYAEELTALAHERMQLENALREAVTALHYNEQHACQLSEGFYLCYQPQVDLYSKRIQAAEALIRWKHEQLGDIAPNRFIPIAEENALVLQLDRWVLCQACHQAKQWLDAGLSLNCVSVNISALQLQRGNVVNIVEQALQASQLSAHHLELEVTEGLFIGALKRASNVFNELRDLGVRLAIDDFGTGYSSLSYLEHLHVDKLKLDRSLLNTVDNNPQTGKVAAAAIALGRALQLKVLCEGIETQAQENFLKANECHEGQGFLYSPAVSAAEFEALLKKQNTS